MQSPNSTNSSLIMRYREVVQRIQEATCSRIGKSPPSVTLIAVSKLQSVDQIEELYREGHRDFGENYVQELLEKDAELKKRGCGEIRWHFIGHLQKNKVKKLIPVVFCIHTIDSMGLVREVSKACSRSERIGDLPIFLEVNVDREESKFGLIPEDVKDVARSIGGLSGLRLEGLMCIPSHGENPQPRFALLRQLSNECGELTRGCLSMGMSSDFELAIQEGSTHVRVGTSLFGPRSTSTL